MKKALEEFENNVTVADALRKLDLGHQTNLLDGMRVTLMAHQVIGVSWMVDQENDQDKRGGMLADAMGKRSHTFESVRSDITWYPYRSRKDSANDRYDGEEPTTDCK